AEVVAVAELGGEPAEPLRLAQVELAHEVAAQFGEGGVVALERQPGQVVVRQAAEGPFAFQLAVRDPEDAVEQGDGAGAGRPAVTGPNDMRRRAADPRPAVITWTSARLAGGVVSGRPNRQPE